MKKTKENTKSKTAPTEIHVTVTIPSTDFKEVEKLKTDLGEIVMKFEAIMDRIRFILMSCFKSNGLKNDMLVDLLCFDSTAINLSDYLLGTFQILFPDYYKSKMKYFTSLKALIMECSNIRNSLVHSSFGFIVVGSGDKPAKHYIAPSKRKVFSDAFDTAFTDKTESILSTSAGLSHENMLLIIGNLNYIIKELSDILKNMEVDDWDKNIEDVFKSSSTPEKLSEVTKSFNSLKRKAGEKTEPMGSKHRYR